MGGMEAGRTGSWLPRSRPPTHQRAEDRSPEASEVDGEVRKWVRDMPVLRRGHTRGILLRSGIGLLEAGIVKPMGESSKAEEAGSSIATASQDTRPLWEERNVY